MRTALTIVLAAAAFLAAGTMAFADTYYTLSNPRIIHVPQPGQTARDSHASLSRVAPDDPDDEDVAPPPSHRAAKPQPRAKTVTRQQPKTVTHKDPVRRKPSSVSLPEPPPEPEPEPTGPRRALLSAPPPPPTSSIHDGPTPLRPTPRFGQPLPEPPAPLTTFTPPAPAPVAKPVAVAAPAPEPSAAAPASEPVTAVHPIPADDNDDYLPPPGDPKLAPPEPKN